MTPPVEHRTARRAYTLMVKGTTGGIQLYVTAEILWTFLHPSDPHLYEMAWERVKRYREHLKYQAAVAATLRSIRRLPENDK